MEKTDTNNRIKTYVVHGFLESGKTSYIQECIFNGFFHKHGSTLIVSFEDGVEEYDTDRLRQFRTDVVLYEGREDISAFFASALEKYSPDRIYIEMNDMITGLREQLPPVLDIVFTVTLIDGKTLPLYFNNMRQILQNMITDSQMAIINRCEIKEDLAPYGIPFRIMNRNCDYIWLSPMGYSEKAFGRLLPYDLSASSLRIQDDDYAVFHLDAHENPQSYDGKTVSFLAQIRTIDEKIRLGRSVMTCCLQDIQFLGFTCSVLETTPSELREGMWVYLTAKMQAAEGRYHVKTICLTDCLLQPHKAPAESIIGLRRVSPVS